MVIVLSWFGIIAVMSSLIPLVAISPILLYIGMLIGAQAFQETPERHAPAVVLALIPNIAAWGKLLVDSSLGAAGTNAATVGFDKLGQVGVLYHGLEVLGAGAILGGMVLGAIAAFVIDKKYTEASYFAAAGAVLTFFGFMHGEAVGIRGVAFGRGGLCDRRRVPLRLEPRARHGAGSGSRARCDPCGVAVASLLRLRVPWARPVPSRSRLRIISWRVTFYAGA